MYKLLKILSITIGLTGMLNASSSTWVPIMMGDITTFIPYGQSNALKTLKNVYKPNDIVSVKVDAALSGDQDWVGVYHKNDSNAWANVVAWNFIPNNGTFALNEIKKTMPVGAYEARLFFHNNYEDKATYPFSVSTDTFKTLKTQYTPNEEVSVMVNVPLSNDQDWVGIFPKNSSNAWGNVIAWNWVGQGNTVLSKKIPGKTMPAGEYEVRLFFHNSYISEISFPFTVNAGQQFTYVPTTDMDKPAYTTSYVETNFASSVTRITNRAIQVHNYHPYSKQGNSWNSDMSILRIGYRLYDPVSFQELAVTSGLNGSQVYAKLGSPAHGLADIRWSKLDPNMMYVLDSSQRYKKVIVNANRTNTSTEILINLSIKNYANISIGNNEGNLDYNDEYIVFSAQTNVDDTVHAMLYHIGDNDVVWNKVVSRGLWGKPSNHPDNFDWITVDPTAQYIVVGAEHKRYVYDMNLNNERLLASVGAHGDIGIDVNGNPVYVQFQFVGEEGIWSHNLSTLEAIKLLPSKYNGGHVSCRNVKRPGWCYLNTSKEGYKEVFALKLDNGSGIVERFAQTHISTQNRGCAQVSVSPDGNRVLFSSDWNVGLAEDYQWDRDTWKSCTDDNRRIKLDTYQVKFD